MAVDYAALKAELETDPKGFGYAALVRDRNDSALTDLLNKVDWPPTDPHFESIPRASVPAHLAAAYVDAAEFAALAPGLQNYLLFVAAASGGQEIPFIDPTDLTGQVLTPFFIWLQTAFPPNTKTGAKLAQLENRPASRAEVVLGPGSVVDVLDIAAALRTA